MQIGRKVLTTYESVITEKNVKSWLFTMLKMKKWKLKIFRKEQRQAE